MLFNHQISQALRPGFKHTRSENANVVYRWQLREGFVGTSTYTELLDCLCKKRKGYDGINPVEFILNYKPDRSSEV